MNEIEFLNMLDNIRSKYPMTYEHILSLVFIASNLDQEKSPGYSENLLLKALQELDT